MKLKPDLQAEYTRLNQLIFGGKLPENITLKWNHSKTCLGKTKIEGLSFKGKLNFHIYISKFFICSEKEYIETLIHEMIHVLMAVKGEFKNDKRVHGPLFRQYMNQINNQFPQYTIKIKEDKKLEIDHSRIKIQNGFFLVTEHDKKYFNLYKDELNHKIVKKVLRVLKSGFRIKKGELYTFKGKYSELATAPIRKNMNTLTGKLQYLHNKEEMENLLRKIKNDSLNVYSLR